MFDELDDPIPPAAWDGARAGVALRAARIRRNRRTGVVAGAASLVLVAAAVGAGLRGGTEGMAHLEPLTSQSPSESPSQPGETAEPSASPAAAEPSSQQPAARPAPASPSPEPSYREWEDGCTTAPGLPRRGTAPHPDLGVALVVPSAIDTTNPPTALLRFTNSSDTDSYAFSIEPLTGAFVQTAAVDDAGHRSAYHHSDYIAPGRVEVVPGGTYDYEVVVNTKACDENGDYAGELPAGEYRMAVGFKVSHLEISGSRSDTVTVGPGEDSPDPLLPPLSPSPSPSPSPTDDDPEPSATPPPDTGDGTWGTAAVSVTFR